MRALSPILIIVALLLAANVTMTQTPPRNDATGASSDSAIANKLREIVAIRQRLVEANQRAVRTGHGETDGRYELDLAEARVELARELGQRNEQLAALQDILKVHQRRLEEAKKRAGVGAESPGGVDTIRVAVLEAEVRLLRAQNSLKRP